MGYYLTIGGETQDSLASISGWRDVKEWSESLDADRFDNLIHLVEHGWTQELDELESQVEDALSSDPPDNKSVLDTLRNLLAIAQDRPDGAESAFVTDGMGPIDDGFGDTNLNLDCGTGEGGFKPGNTCASGSGKVGKGSGWQVAEEGSPDVEVSDPSLAFDETPQLSIGRELIETAEGMGRDELVESLSSGEFDPDATFASNAEKARNRFMEWADRNADDNDEINGEHFEDHAERMFAEWLPSPEDVADAIIGASGRNLSNTSPPRSIPPQDVITERGLSEARRELRRLYQRIREWHRTQSDGKLAEDVQTAMKRIRQILSDTRTVSRIAGMISPWLPELADHPPGTPMPEQLDLALKLPNPFGLTGNPEDGDRWRFPFLENAFDFLWEKELLSHEEFSKIEREDQQEVFAAPGVSSVDVAQRLRDDLIESLVEGESFEEFQSRMRDDIDATEHEVETMFRTHTHQAYIEGQERTLEKPEVKTMFPFAMFAATNDTRVRDEHWALDGFVIRRDTEEYEIARRALADWNCRCAFIPLTEVQAESRDIKTLADMPPEVLAKYGN